MGQASGDPRPVRADGDVPAVAGLAGGGHVVVWDTYDAVRAQRFDADGRAVGEAFQVNRASGLHQQASVTALPDGGFAVGWAGYVNSKQVIQLRFFGSDGHPTTGDLTVAAQQSANVYFPDLTTTAGGDVLVSWSGSEDQVAGRTVFPRRVPAEGVVPGEDLPIETSPAVCGISNSCT